MKKIKLIVILVAVICLVAGGALSCAALAMVGFDVHKLQSEEYEEVTFPVDEAFSAIEIEDSGCDVELIRSEDGTCKVVCDDSEKVYHTVQVTDGVLTVRQTDERRWYEHIGLWFGTRRVRIYLPADRYDRLTASVGSGNVTVPAGFTFRTGTVECGSGNIVFDAAAEETFTLSCSSGNVLGNGGTFGDLTVQSNSGNIVLSDIGTKGLSVGASSGNVRLNHVRVEGVLSMRAASGSLSMEQVRAASLSVEATSGDVRLSDVLISGHLAARVNSGNIRMTRCDAETLYLGAVSGNISGSLLSGKTFVTQTSSGSVRVPGSSVGGRCEIVTSSGNIRVTVEGS